MILKKEEYKKSTAIHFWLFFPCTLFLKSRIQYYFFTIMFFHSIAWGNENLSRHIVDGNDELEHYLKSLAENIAQKAKYNQKKINVKIYNSIIPNAFVNEKGTIYITSGFLFHFDDPNQIAAVLAHEIAHLKLKHIQKRRQYITKKIYKRFKNKKLYNDDKALLEFINANSYTQKQELEADKFALKYLKKSRHSTESYLELLQTIELLEKIPSPLWDNKKETDIETSTHPSTEFRIKSIKNTKPSSQAIIIDKNQYRQILEKSKFFKSNSVLILRDKSLYKKGAGAYIEFPKNSHTIAATVDSGSFKIKNRSYNFQIFLNDDIKGALEKLLKWEFFGYKKITNHNLKDKNEFRLQSKINQNECILGTQKTTGNIAIIYWSIFNNHCNQLKNGTAASINLIKVSQNKIKQAYELGITYIKKEKNTNTKTLKTFSHLDEINSWINETNTEKNHHLRAIH